MTRTASELLRIVALLLVSAVSLQLCFLGRVALMAFVDPQSTSFQRSEAWRLLSERRALAWQQSWVDYPRLSQNLKHAVIASEDAGFRDHHGVEWDALERAWGRNQKAEQKAELRTGQANERLQRRSAGHGKPESLKPPARFEPHVVGASTITQQLAKNLFLGSERTLLRKGQEFIITFLLEALLSKARIFEIYLNNVEWGEGIFGAEAAARRYFGIPASELGAAQAARLAVMLPAPKRFEKRPASDYVLGRSATVMARMGAVAVP